MDLSALTSSLPPGLADAERDMGEKFRAAALSITTLYKSSLACNKQAYQVGYSAALADVLSKLQSDIAAGEDAAAALARLMDWTEARQAAMAAFAADDDDFPPASTTRSAVPQRLAPPRPASAPVERARGFGKEREHPVAGPSRTEAMDADDQPQPQPTLTPTPASTSTSAAARRPVAPATPLERAPSPGPVLQHPHPHPSSSPIASPSISRPLAPPPLRLLRTTSSRATPSTSAAVPTSTFNFSLPASLDIPHLPAAAGPAQTGAIGAKRPIVDAEMADGALSAPATPSRGGRAVKRRSMGIGMLGESEEKGSSERRRPARRGGGMGA